MKDIACQALIQQLKIYVDIGYMHIAQASPSIYANSSLLSGVGLQHHRSSLVPEMKWARTEGDGVPFCMK